MITRTPASPASAAIRRVASRPSIRNAHVHERYLGRLARRRADVCRICGRFVEADMMAPPQRDDPYEACNFLVEIDGTVRAGFSEVSGLESETTVIEYRDGSESNRVVRKLPGLTKYANIVLRRGVTQDSELWDWRKTVEEGKVDRRNGSIILLADDGTEVLRWNFHNGWISKWQGPVLNARGNEVAIETIEIAHEGLERA